MTKKKLVTNYKWNGYTMTFTWISTTDFEGYKPITQIYGVCVNDKGEVMIQRKTDKHPWSLPGGTVEKGESLEETLRRELLEEVDIEIEEIKTIGIQRVDFPNNPDKNVGDVFYQARSFGRIKKLLPQTPDPDNGKISERKLVPLNKMNEYLKWGEIGEEITAEAIRLNGQK